MPQKNNSYELQTCRLKIESAYFFVRESMNTNYQQK